MTTKNYHPVSMFTNFKKMFEKLLFEEVNNHMENEFSKHLTGFHKNHSTQNTYHWEMKSNSEWKIQSKCYFYWFFKSSLIL